jgi:putative endonuclease
MRNPTNQEKKPTYRQKMGRWGEDLAADFLVQAGYQILERNVRTEYGEIDLVACHDQALVFVEVKARSSTAYGMPESGLTLQKQSHLLNAVQAYLQMHPEWPGDWRIDVIAILGKRGQPGPEIIHFEHALG